MIRSSKHTLKFTNSNKTQVLSNFVDEYRRVAKVILDEIWENGYGDFHPSLDKLNGCPKYLDYNKFKVKTSLSARVLRTLTTQLVNILRGSIKKRKSTIYLFESGKISREKADKILRNYPLRKPNLDNVKPELNSICCDFRQHDGEFDLFIALKCLGKQYNKICLPIKHTRISRKWANQGSQLNSISLDKQKVTLRFKIQPKNQNKGTKVIGVDQGLKTVATLSDGQTTPFCDAHQHTLESIITKLVRKKKGSLAFKKAQEHRKNFIHWSINQLNFTGLREIRLEKIWNIGYKKRKSRKLSHWTNTLIRDKIKSRAEELEVPVIEQDCSYRSQRCFSCGIVRKANRKGKIYKCKHCNYEADADYNASLNHSIDLPRINWRLRSQRLNLGCGFYWKPTGIFTYDGKEFTVPFSENKIL